MRERERGLLAVRTIEVTTRNALQKVAGAPDRTSVRTMATTLLDHLEDRILRQGGDLVLLEAVGNARRTVWD